MMILVNPSNVLLKLKKKTHDVGTIRNLIKWKTKIA